MSQDQYHIKKIFGNTEEPLSRDKLVRYAKGESSPAEAHEVERYLIDDPFAADALEGLKMVGAAQFEAALDEILESINEGKDQEAKVIPFAPQQEDKAARPVPSRKYNFRRYSIAASVLILVAAGMLFFFPGKKGNSSLADSYYDIEEAALIITRTADVKTGPTPDYFAEGKKFFAHEDYAKAAPLLAKASSPEAKYYAGHAYYLQSKYDSAASEFLTVVDSNSEYVQQASWYLALTYLKLDQIEKSQGLLEGITQDPASDFSEKAGTLLGEISDRND